MPRFLLFAGDRYYPSGGFNDLVTSRLETEEEVSVAIEALIKAESQDRGFRLSKSGELTLARRSRNA